MREVCVFRSWPMPKNFVSLHDSDKYLKFKKRCRHSVSTANEYKIEKSYSISMIHVDLDINTLNLYGESALSMATYYNQILCVEYLLAHQADPKL